MAIFAEANTSSYSDPMRALSIKALEQRQKDLLAQQSARDDSATMATIPGGIGHVLGVIGDSMQQSRADQALAARRQDLAKVMSGIGPEGPTSEQIAGIVSADPELGAKYAQQVFEARQAAAARAQETSRDTTRYGFEGTQKEADRKAAADLQQGTQTFQHGENVENRTAAADLEAKKETFTSGQTDKQIQATRDLATQSQRANADLAAAERDLKTATQANDLAFRGQDRAAQTAASQALEEVKSRHAIALANVNNAATAAENDKGRAATAANQGTQIRSTEKLAADQIGSTERLAAAKQAFDAAQAELTRANQSEDQQAKIDATAKLAAAQHGYNLEENAANNAAKAALPQSPVGQVAADAANPTLKLPADVAAGATNLLTAPSVKQVDAQTAATTAYRQHSQSLDKLERAQAILNHPEGINTGPWADAKTTGTLGLADVPLVGGLVSDKAKEKAQRTTDFNSLVNENAIKEMSTTLKGQSTDFEMQKFIDVMNNPKASPAERRERLNALIQAAQVDKQTHANALRQLRGDPDSIDKQLRSGLSAGSTGRAAAPAPAAGGGGVATGLTEQEAMKLPAGTKFQLRDGRTGTAR